MENIKFYFAYGSNMNPERVKKRKVNFLTAEAATLSDFYLAFNKKSHVYPGAASANIVRLQNEVPKLDRHPGVHFNQGVEGVLYQLEDAEQIFSMDPFEGFPLRYSRIEVDVQTSRGQEKTWTYTANVDYLADGLKPNNWYLNHLLSGQAYLSEAYFKALQKIPTLPNSDLEPEG